MGDSRSVVEGSSAPTDGSSSWTSVRVSNTQRASLNKEHLELFPEYDQSMVSVGRKIGEGGQGSVYAAKFHLPYSFQPVPMVVKKFKPFLGVSQGHFPPEMAFVNTLNLCLPLGVFFEGESLCLILERYLCDLRAAINSRVNAMREQVIDTYGSLFADGVSAGIIVQLAVGLKCLHELGVYHGDLKAANILIRFSAKNYDTSLSMGVHVALADFERSDGIVGTGFFRSPEVLQSLRTRVPLSKEEWLLADVYSFGMVCYELLTGRIPFEGHPLSDYDLVLNGERPELPKHVPEFWRDLILRCWLADPHSRPSWNEIIEVVAQNEAAHAQHDHALARHNDRFVSGDFWNYVRNLGDVESLSFESLIRESKQLVRYLTALHERDSKNFRIEFMPCYWASQVIATAEEFASKFGGDALLDSPVTCLFPGLVERGELLELLAHQLDGLSYRLLSFKDVVRGEQSDDFEYAYEAMPRRRWLSFMLAIIVRRLDQEYVRLVQEAMRCATVRLDGFHAGTSWTAKLLYYHASVKWVLWYEHVENGFARAFMMDRLFPTRWSRDAAFEAGLIYFCMMGNTFIYVLLMVTCELLLLGLQYVLYKMWGSKSILYRSSGERICRFQRAWMNCTRYKAVGITLCFSLVTLLVGYGWKGFFGWIIIFCVVIWTPFWRRPARLRK